MKEIRDRNGLTEEEFLRQYKPGDYPRPSVAADMVIFTVTEEEKENYRRLPEKELRVLLIQRGGHPFLGCWALPGGFVRPVETSEEAARRELKEETGVDQVYLEQLYTFSDVGRDPRTWVMSCSYMALIDSARVWVKAGDDADNAAWFGLTCQMVEESSGKKDGTIIKRQKFRLELRQKEIILKSTIEKVVEKHRCGQRCEYRILENDGLAFDHAKIIIYAIERLRGKLEYTDLALHLMPEYFTLTQLQQVYEVILDKKLLNAAFRRKVAGLVEETDSFTENEGHRPSRLYRRKGEVIE
ncbi:NUDIX domain-containing protein [Clostridium sp. MCC353]|uniref:NrtR DNA-binding winged helix domain-containing protein n=1 Tax=Clostridium sp. MCC353 TaxID=2592646 RepID=UPI001C00FB73|nr:NUDIX domain-containing protein [Clostridium sp. MCC353]MBT9777983.1 NUDIX domain-containing protein [Clostridium sp. MCC353]